MASTSRVARGSPAAESVISNPVTEPPTNTTSSSKGRKRRAAMINCSRFESSMGASQPLVQLGLGDLAFASASIAQCVGEDEIFIECRIAQCGEWCRPVQRRECHTPLLAIDG